jgi:ABC-2 type transport system ATP-binding protein
MTRQRRGCALPARPGASAERSVRQRRNALSDDERDMVGSRPGRAAAVVRLQHVSKAFGPKTAVSDVSLELYAGEVFAFLGPNGAGKTTTLRITTGLLRPDRGEVQLCGHDVARADRLAKEALAYIPDEPFIYEKLTGREFLQFTWEMYGVPPSVADQRLTELTARLSMGEFLDQLAETYSHGMKQRVALAAALIHAPRVLVVDEPMVGLDPRTIRIAKDMFRELASRGGTVLMSTHTLDIAEQMADRIGIIHHGRLTALGSLQELQRQAALDGRLEDVFLHLTQGD